MSDSSSEPGGTTRRRVLGGWGGLLGAIGFGALAKPALARAAAFGTNDGHLYVSESGSDRNDGLAWATALATVSGALAINADACVHVGKGTFRDSFKMTGTAGRVDGSGAGTIIMAPTDTSVIAELGNRCFMSNLRLAGGPSFTGVLLRVTGQRNHVFDVDLRNTGMNDAGNGAQWQNGSGGIALHLYNNEPVTGNVSEGNHFESLSISKVRLALSIGGANNQFTNIRGDQCWQVLKFDSGSGTVGKSGSHVFNHMKFVLCGNTFLTNPAVVNTVQISGSDNCFIEVDVDESDNSAHIVSGDGNHFIKHAVAPGCHMTISGDGNRFDGLRCNDVTVTGSNNVFFQPDVQDDRSNLVVMGTNNVMFGERNGTASGAGIKRLATQ